MACRCPAPPSRAARGVLKRRTGWVSRPGPHFSPLGVPPLGEVEDARRRRARGVRGLAPAETVKGRDRGPLHDRTMTTTSYPGITHHSTPRCDVPPPPHPLPSNRQHGGKHKRRKGRNDSRRPGIKAASRSGRGGAGVGGGDGVPGVGHGGERAPGAADNRHRKRQLTRGHSTKSPRAAARASNSSSRAWASGSASHIASSSTRPSSIGAQAVSKTRPVPTAAGSRRSL